MKKQKSIDHCLRATWQAVAKLYNEEAGKFGETMASAFVLLNIDRENGTLSTSLGPKMGMEATSLSRVLRNLDDKKMIRRERSEVDKRKVYIKLTEQGEQKRELSKAAVLKFNNAIIEEIGVKEIEQFIETTEKINKIIKEKEIFESNKA
ncbi:MAG: MarR family transcriptional regulator [Flavobacteriaceae bacterium]|nr:MarR family transcriptional regulator [Flavobacteriaceae bacterium]